MIEQGKFVFIKGTSSYSPRRIGRILLKNGNDYPTKYWVMVTSAEAELIHESNLEEIKELLND